MNILEVKNLKTKFIDSGTANEALQGVDFTLEQGKVLGVVGETGSGKTLTTLSFLGLVNSSSAQITAEAIRYYRKPDVFVDLKASADEFQKNLSATEIAIVFQNARSALNPLVKCGKLLDRLLRKHTKLNKVQRLEKVLAHFNLMGFADSKRIYHSYPHQLSGGEIQRVSITLSLVCEPKLLILDEPTSALDLIVQKEIIDLLIEVKRKRSLSLIFISHNLPLLGSIADHIIHIDEGQVIESLSVDDFFGKPKHKKTIKLLNELSKFHSRSLEKRSQSTTSIIKVSNICKSFRKSLGWKRLKFEALEDVSFSVFENERLGIIGESGCGKTTLAKCISGALVPDKGKIEYFVDRKSICYIFQDAFSAMDPDLSVYEIINEVFLVSHSHLKSSQRHEQISMLLEQVKLGDEFLQRKPHQMSGGQRQRVNIARALATGAKVFICDEVTAGLDLNIQYQIMNLLMDLSENRTLIFISHDLSLLRKSCDRIVVMRKGKILEVGENHQIFSKQRHEYTKTLINSMVLVKYFLNK